MTAFLVAFAYLLIGMAGVFYDLRRNPVGEEFYVDAAITSIPIALFWPGYLAWFGWLRLVSWLARKARKPGRLRR